jgi:hypothetical protein
MKDLCRHDPQHGGNAAALLMLLRSEHGARTLRGETFALDVKAMAECKTLDWSSYHFRHAIRVLLETGYVKLVQPFRNSREGRIAAQYTLVPRTLSVFREAMESPD